MYVRCRIDYMYPLRRVTFGGSLTGPFKHYFQTLNLIGVLTFVGNLVKTVVQIIIELIRGPEYDLERRKPWVCVKSATALTSLCGNCHEVPVEVLCVQFFFAP